MRARLITFSSLSPYPLGPSHRKHDAARIALRVRKAHTADLSPSSLYTGNVSAIIVAISSLVLKTSFNMHFSSDSDPLAGRAPLLGAPPEVLSIVAH